MALRSPIPWFGVAYTKADLVDEIPALADDARGRLPGDARVFVTSAADKRGLDGLRQALQKSAGASTTDAGGPLRTALQECQEAVRRAVAVGIAPEVAAVELQAALRALDGVAGAHSSEHLLDRIYGRFCLGK